MSSSVLTLPEESRVEDRRTAAAWTGILLALAAILMFFLALTSAFVVRQGTSNDWVKVPLPAILYGNTIVLLGSSAAIEIARRNRRAGNLASFRPWWWAAVALGAAFLAGQLLAWRQLQDAGIYLASNPSASFLYILTAAHGAHLVGGLVALALTGWRGGSALALDIASIYWHFMGGLWVYLLALLLLWG